MDGISVRELSKTSFARLNQVKDPENFHAELVRLIRGDFQHIEVFSGLFDVAASKVLHVPSWLRSHLERHPGLIVKLEEGEMVGITHEPDASARRAGAAPASVVLIPLLSDGRLQAAIGLVSPLDGPHLSAEEIEAVRHIAREASPILARLQEIESLKRRNQELAEKAERAAIAEAHLAKVTDEKIRSEALIKIASHVQSNIAHDLRTPLGAIRGYARMIIDGRAGDTNNTQRNYLRIIAENTNRVINIANWMSHVAELSGQPIAVRAFDLREVWAESVRAAHGLLSSKALTLTQRIPQESFEIIADREKLAFAFKEILSAAVKLSEAGSAITAEFSLGRQREVIVKITAKGSDMRAEALSGIFDHSTSTTGVSQTDEERQMNLSSAHEVIGIHGGRLFVKSTAGEDCTFWFTLPNITLGGEDKSHEQTFNLGRR